MPVLKVDEERWEDNRMIFRVRALGQAASGNVDVAEDHVRVEVTLPFLLQRFAEMAQAVIRERGKLLLTKRWSRHFYSVMPGQPGHPKRLAPR